MWEFNIYINNKYIRYLNYIKENIMTSKNYTKGIFAIAKIDNNAVLSIAIEKPSNALLNEIKHYIAESIIYSEKENYISQKKFIPKNEFRTPLIKVLVLLNISSDIDYVANLINLNDSNLNIHSFFNFKLNKLKNKWESSINSFTSKNEETTGEELLDILKLIIESNPSNNKAVIEFNGSNYILDIDKKRISANDEIDIISNLIISSPNKIDIQCKDNLSCDSLILLNYLFNNKITITN